MTCFFCKGEMEQGLTVHVEELNGCIIVIKNVPCEKCKNCGEVFYSGAVLEKIEEIVNKLRNVITEITVVNYSVA